MLCSQCGKDAPDGARFCVSCGTKLSDPEADTLVPEEENESDILLRSVRRELAGDYQIDRELGRGGMAIVYEAVDIQLGRRVALKVLPPEMALRRSMADRFKREAKMAAALDHPNIVPVYRVGQSGGLLYIAMKYIRGRALDDILEAQGPLPVSVVLHILRGAASALAYAHERGIVHRDVKSANIMIDLEGRPVVSDFGIARTVEEPQMTATGAVVGTPYFMSPEQCAARRIGPQSDQYSLGVVAFQMLSGTVPFSADTLPGIMHHHFYTPVPDLRLARAEIPAALNEVVQRLLSKKSEQRYGSTQALADQVREIPLAEADRRDAERMLRDLAGGAPVARVAVAALPPLQTSVRLTPAAVPTIVERIRRRVTRPVMAVTSATAVVMLASGGWLVASRFGDTPEPQAEQSSVPQPSSAAVGPAATESPAVGGDRASSATEGRDTRDGGTATSGGARPPTPPSRSDSTAAPDPTPAPKAISNGIANGTSNGSATRQTVPPRTESAVVVQTGKLRMKADPPSAAIHIDDVLINHGTVIDAVLRAGTRRLRVVAPGFETHETTIEIVGGETLVLPKITLTPRGDPP